MNEASFLETLGIMVVTCGVLLVVARKLSVPSIVLFMAAGLILGPLLGIIDLTAAFGAAHHVEGVSGAIAAMSHLGIALLLFLVGLELSLERIRDVGKVAALAGVGQVSITAALGFGLSLLLGFGTVEAGFLAVALTFSSTVVVVKLLGQKRETHALHGRIAVGVLLVQDLVVIIALTFLAGLGSAEALDPTQVARDLGFAFGGMALMLAGAAIFSRFILPRPFEWASRRPEMLLIWSLSLCFVFVTTAEFLGLSPEIGAFLAGMSLAQLHCAHELTRRVQSLMNFFIAVFFVTLGAQMQLAEVGDDLIPALLLSVFVLIGKPIVLMLVIPRLGYNAETSFKTGITLAQISEFSFILAAMGMASGLIGKNILAVIAIVGLSTIVVSSYGILYLDALHRFVARTGILKLLKAPEMAAMTPAIRRSQHIIVVGMNSMGRHIVTSLAERGESVLALDTDPKKLAELSAETMLGNVEDLHVLEECHYESAKLVVSTLQIEDTNNLVAYYCRQAEIPCAIHGFDATVLDDLRALNVTFLIDSKQIGMAELTERIRTLGFTNSPQPD